MITKTGVIAKKSGDKTVRVRVDSYVLHSKYKKNVLITRYFMVHDEKNAGKEGDTVIIVQSRPVSNRKAWTLLEIKERAV